MRAPFYYATLALAACSSTGGAPYPFSAAAPAATDAMASADSAPSPLGVSPEVE